MNVLVTCVTCYTVYMSTHQSEIGPQHQYRTLQLQVELWETVTNTDFQYINMRIDITRTLVYT